MGKVSISYVIYQRHKQVDGRYPIKLRFIFARRSTLVSTNMYASEEDLCPLKKGEEGRSRVVKNVNLRRKVENLIREYEDATNLFDSYLFPDWTVTEVVNYLHKLVHKDNFRLDFIDFFDSFINDKEKSSHQAALNYKAAKKALCTHMGRNKFDISLITSAQMRSFEAYLVDTYGQQARAVSLYTSAVATVHKAARLKYNSEEMGELAIKNPFEYYTPPKHPAAKHRDVSVEVVQRMINDYPSLLGRTRFAVGAFLLSFVTMGMNTPDLFSCELIDGKIIHYFRTKTRERRKDNAEMYVQLPDCARALWQEYLNKIKKNNRAFNFYLRYSSVKTMQDAEKYGMAAYKDKIKYEGALTNYSARHTWATIARSAQCKIDVALIDDCLCHTNGHQMADIYAKKDYSVLWEANEKVLSVFDWSPLKPSDK